MISSDVYPLRSHSQKKLRATSFVTINRTKSFQNNYSNTYANSLTSSNVYRLANRIYSKNIDNKKRRLSGGLIKRPSNPEMVDDGQKYVRQKTKSVQPQALLQSLNKRTTVLVDYQKQIKQLNITKQQTSTKIMKLKYQIAQQKKLKSKLSIQSNKHLNSTQHNQDYKNKLLRQSSRNKDQLNRNEEQCNRLIQYLKDIDYKNDTIRMKIESERELVQSLGEKTKELKHQIFKNNSELNLLKTNLTIGLKAMKNSVDIITHLESKKADLLLFVNNQI